MNRKWGALLAFITHVITTERLRFFPSIFILLCKGGGNFNAEGCNITLLGKSSQYVDSLYQYGRDHSMTIIDMHEPDVNEYLATL